jgi:ceramide glucosyltransferase
VLALIGWVAFGIGLCGAGFAVASARWAASSLARESSACPDARVAPGVTVFKPLHGAEDGLYENLESFCRQVYAGPVQLLFGIHGADDAAAPIVRDLQRNYPLQDIQLVVDGRLHGENRKVSNLVNMEAAAAHEVLVLSDSDIRVGPDYLQEVVARLHRPGVGFVTCLYTGGDVGSVWSKLAAMGIDYQFLPNVAAGLRLNMAEPCFGATVAFRRRVLDEIGGFARLNNQLADDYDLGRAIRQAGYTGEVAATPVQHLCAERSLSDLWRHEKRWARTIRMIDPVGAIGQGFTYATAWALLGCICTGFHPLATAGLLASIAARLYLVHRVDGATGARAQAIWLLPLRDLFSFAVFLSACFGNTVTWRGRRFRIGPDGALVPAKEFSPYASHPVLAGAILRRLRRGRGIALPSQARNQILLVSDVARPAGGLGRDQQADRRPAA